MNLEELHDCKKSHGKLVCISVDKLGIERCGYCNEIVDYKGWIMRQLQQNDKRRT